MAPAARAASYLGNQARMMIPGVDTAARMVSNGATRLANVPRAVLDGMGIGAGRVPLQQPGQRATDQADRILAQRMGEGHIQAGMGQNGAEASPAAIQVELQRRSALGVPAMVADTTEPMRAVTAWASRGMGRGQTAVRQALDARKAQEASRVSDHITAEMGPTVDPDLALEQHMRSARAAAGPGYQAAYAQPMVITPKIHTIMQTPAFRDALPGAVRNIQNAKRDPHTLGFHMDADGNIAGISTLSTEGFDQVVRAMRDNASAGMRPPSFPGGRPSNTSDTIHINARAAELRDRLGDQNEAYRDVTGRYADDMAHKDAFIQGGDISKLTGHQINAQAREMPQGAQGAWSLGARTALADSASEFGAAHPTGNTAQHITRTLGDDVKQEAIGNLMGNTGAVRGLQERLEAEHQGNLTWRAVNGNSRTAHNQAIDRDLDASTGAKGWSAVNPRNWLPGVLNHLGSLASTQYRNDVKARIAQVVTETNPRNVQELMAAIADRARRDHEFAGALHRSGILATKAYASNVDPKLGD